MNNILYGNLRIEIFDDHGARVSRLSTRAANPRRWPSGPAQQDRAATLLGRTAQLSDTYAAIRDQRPIEFTATCGYGKTTLLRYLADNAADQGVADVSVYLRTGPEEPADTIQRLFTELYIAEPPVKPTAEQCAELVGQTHALIVLDDVMLSPGGVEYLVRMLAGCGQVLGSGRPVLGRHGTSQVLPGLPDTAALQLVSRELGRPVADGELTSVRELVTAVDGQPLHLRQAAALVRETGRSFTDLARIAGRDPDELDRLSVNGLAGQERRALAVLALAGGEILPAALVGAMGDVATIAVSLEQLRRRGLAEERADRFSLPVCKVAGYRAMVLKDLQLATAVREIIDWLANRDPTSADSLSAVGGALAIIEWAGEAGDWPTVVSLARVAEPVLTLAGRWEASRHVLDRGLEAAKAIGDQAAQALFAHEQGTLALCRDELDVALRLLEKALSLREQLGDQAGAAATRHNLALLRPAPAAPPPPRYPPRRGRSVRRALAGVAVLACLLVAWVGVRAVAFNRPAAAPTPGVTHRASPSPTPQTHPASSAVSSGASSAGPTLVSSGSPTTPSNGTTTTTPAQVQPAVTGTDFDSVDITSGTAPESGPVTITNPGTGPLSITSTAVTPGPFSKTSDGCSGTTVQPDQSCTVTVQFAPTGLGVSSATLTIDYGADQAASATLQGTGFVTLDVIVQAQEGATGSVQDSATGYSCANNCQEIINAPDETPATFTAIPCGSTSTTASPCNSSAFATWEGACASSGTSSTCQLPVTSDAQVIAYFSNPDAVQ